MSNLDSAIRTNTKSSISETTIFKYQILESAQRALVNDNTFIVDVDDYCYSVEKVYKKYLELIGIK